MISSPGIGSGIEVASLVSQLVTAERAPAQLRLAGQEARAQTQLSAIGVLRAALDEFSTALDRLGAPLSPLRASSSAATVLTATASTGALAGTYAVEVETLASAQRLTSGAYANAQAPVGDGTLTLTVGTQTANVVIPPGTGTLQAIRDAIAGARDADGKALPVTASLVTSSGGPEPAGTYLVLRATNTGTAGAMTLSASGGDGGLAALTFPGALTETPAQDTRLRVDGLPVTSSTTTVTGALPGLSFEARTVGSATVTVAAAADDGVGALRGAVDAYNRLHAVVAEQGRFNPDGNSGPLLGDAALRGLSTALRQALGAGARVPGLSTAADGTLRLDEAALRTALKTDPDAVAAAVQGPAGLMARMQAVADAHGDGSLAARSAGLGRRLETIADARSALDVRMSDLEARLTAQFNALDALVGQLQATGSFLTQQLASLAALRPGGAD